MTIVERRSPFPGVRQSTCVNASRDCRRGCTRISRSASARRHPCRSSNYESRLGDEQAEGRMRRCARRPRSPAPEARRDSLALPAGILLCKSANQVPDFLADPRSASRPPRTPRPVQSKPGPVARDHRFRLRDNKQILPLGHTRRSTIQTVEPLQPRPRSLSVENSDSLPKNEDLKTKLRPRTE